jgi:copper(I)-binding protein
MKMENGVAKMRPIQGLEIKPGETVELKPGSFHVMFVDLKVAGERFDIRLKHDEFRLNRFGIPKSAGF